MTIVVNLLYQSFCCHDVLLLAVVSGGGLSRVVALAMFGNKHNSVTIT